MGNAASLVDDLRTLSLLAEYNEIETPSAAGANAPVSYSQIWALHDTGATHQLFKDIRIFDKSTLKPVSDSNKQLKLAGGGVSLAVHSKGTVRFQAGEGTIFELKECLYVPDLSKNLISGGRLRLRGVREFYNGGDTQSISLVLKALALFNGYIGPNGLMNLAIEPMSLLHSSANTVSSTDNASELQHQQLVNIGNKYLRQMCRHNSTLGMIGGSKDVIECKIRALSKNTQLPYNHTRPHALRFLKYIHVDLCGIMRTKGLCN